MRFSTICSFLAIAGWASASPIQARQASTDNTDAGVFFATVLEEIAATYFGELLDTFNDDDFEAAGFFSAIRDDIIATIASDEGDHFTVLESILGYAPNCTVDFTPAFADVPTALQVARIIDHIAIGAYIGIIANDPESDSLELFAEILSNEAQHAMMMDLTVGNLVTTHAFDMGLNPAEILALISPFKPSCTPPISILPNIPLAISNADSITSNTTLTFDLIGTPCASQPGLSCQVLNGDDATATTFPIDQCSMNGQAGATFIFITTDDSPISSDPLDRLNVPSICAGPALVIIDN